MESALALHRLHFAFTITYHYLFPQLTMGLAPLIVLFKSLALWKGDERYNRAARFWAKVFAINFLFGVITGIPIEFQFGTNWAKFAQYSGGVIASIFQLFPSGDAHGKLIAEHQPVTLAAMEAHFHTEAGASIALVGQPDVEHEKLDNPIRVPKMLSFLTYRRWEAVVRGLDEFP